MAGLNVPAADEAGPPAATRLGRILTSDTAARWQSRILLLVLWMISASAFERIPGPLKTFEFIGKEFDNGEIFNNLSVTIGRALVGLTLVIVIGILTGVAMARWWRVQAFLADIVNVGVALPAFILALLAVMWWGFSITGPIVVVVAAATPLMIINTREGALAVSPELIKMSSAYGVKGFRRLRWLTIPAMTEYIIAGIRSSALAAWGSLLLVEWFGAESGAGFRAHYWYNESNLTGLMAWGVIWIIVVMLIDGLIMGKLLKHYTKWRGADTGSWSATHSTSV